MTDFSTGAIFPSAGCIASMGTLLCLGYGPNFVGGFARSVPGVVVRFTGNGDKEKLVIAVTSVPNFTGRVFLRASE